MPSTFVDTIVDALQRPYSDVLSVPPEPEQTFLLGGRYQDYALAVVFALAFPVLRAILKRTIYTPTGTYCMYTAQGSSAKPDPERMRKWCESAWKLTVYIMFTALAFAVSYGEPWFSDARLLWAGCTHFPPCNLHVTKGVLLFYCVETGFYIQAIHFLAFHEVRRKDWLESMIHHIVTVGLLLYSYHVNFTRVGILIMLLHDISDIFLEGAKLARYSRRNTLSMVIFAAFFISWVLLRMMYFPAVIVRSTLTEPITLVARPHGIQPMPHYAIFNGLLLVLLVLHVYWSWLILQVLLAAIRSSGNSGDVREGDDGTNHDD